MIKYSVIFLFLLFGNSDIVAQKDSGRIVVMKSSRVDTTEKNVKEIVQLYEDYLNSQPDSIYNNPYWNSKEKELYEDFDFSRSSMYQGGMTARNLTSSYDPFIMSVESIGEKYQIRVMFSSPTRNPSYVPSKVWCIQKLNVIKENNRWVFENLLVELSKNWLSKKVGPIVYYYPANFNFEQKEAERSLPFCDDMIKRFNPGFTKEFKYYITSSIDDMGLLENFDYYFVGVTTGKSLDDRILTSKGSEFYPHEFTHKLLPENKNRGMVIEEGLATFLGTKKDPNEYRALLSKLSNDLLSDNLITFKSVVSQDVRFNGYQTAYPAGAAICELIYSISGDAGLIELMAAKTLNYEELISVVMEITNLSLDEVKVKWELILGKYRS